MMIRQIAPIVLILAFFASAVYGAPNADPCPLAPRPRLHIGDQAAVATGSDRLNLRALPAVDTGINVQLYAGNTVTGIVGPSCNGYYNWWRVETANGRRGWVAEGTWEHYYVVPVGAAAVSPVEWSCGVGFGSRRCLLP